MSNHPTVFGNIMHNLTSFIEGLWPKGHKVTASDVISGAEDIAATVNIYAEVRKDTAGIADPAELVRATVKAVMAHESELPANMQGNGLTAFVLQVCEKASSLPLEEIESIIKEELAGINGEAAPAASEPATN